MRARKVALLRLPRLRDFAEGNATVRYKPDSSEIRVESGLPNQQRGSSSATLLTLIQGFRQNVEYALQAAVFAASASAKGVWLVSASDLLLLCNNVQMAPTSLLRFLSRYPHRTRTLLQTNDNVGYRCGHLHAIHRTRHAWEAYETVLFAHPDVYLFPQAVRWLQGVMRTNPLSAFLVTKLTPRHMRGKDGTRKFKVTLGIYGTDLFAFRPRRLRSEQDAAVNGTEAAVVASSSWSSSADAVWRDVCVLPPRERVDWPERALWRLVHSKKLPVAEIGVRSTAARKADSYGVWHAHEPDAVARAIDGMRGHARLPETVQPGSPHARHDGNNSALSR